MPDPLYNPETGPGPSSEEADKAAGEQKRLEVARFVADFVREAERARRAGDPPREEIWRRNLDLYWGRHDFADKAAWQSRETMPEGMVYVDRFAASMTEALLGEPTWYDVKVEGDTARDLTDGMRKWMNFWLARVGTNPTGQTTSFFPVFEELVKMGALSFFSAVVLWKENRVVIEPVDPLELYLDATGRRFGRARRYEIDKTELTGLASQTDTAGKPLYDADAMMAVVRAMPAEKEFQRREIAGHDRATAAPRAGVQITEYYGDVLDMGGEVIEKDVVVVTANDTHVIRGPEKNPYWHGDDWLVACPMISAPLSVWGKTYAETWAGTARAFTDLTNMILDGVYTSVLKVFALITQALTNPEVVQDGLSPNLVLEVEEGFDPNKILTAVDMGHISRDAMEAWAMLKRELQEGAMFSDIAVGQLPGKSDITATEITQSSAGSSALMKSIARGIESKAVEPVLGLVWRTSLQKFDASDADLISAVGKELVSAFDKQRKNLIAARVTFSVTGISGSVDRALKIRAMVNLLQIAAQNPLLFQAFTQVVDIAQLFRELFRLHGIDASVMTLSERQRMIQNIVGTFQVMDQAKAGGGASAAPDPTEALSAGLSAAANMAKEQESVRQAQMKTQVSEVTGMAKMAEAVQPPQQQGGAYERQA